MKKITSCILALLLLVGLFPAGTAFADDYLEYYGFDASQAGLIVYLPAPWIEDAYGVVDLALSEELGYNTGVYATIVVYCAMSPDEFQEYGPDQDSFAPLFTWVCVKDGFDPSAFAQAGINIDLSQAYEIGSLFDGDEEYTFYIIVGADELPYGLTSPYVEEYESYMSWAEDIVNQAEYMIPVNPYSSSIGTVADFQTEDLSGNPVSSLDLFAQHEITMVNLWATWCPHCINEMPELEQINRRLEALGCGVIGLLDDDEYEEAEDIVRQSGVTYPILKSTEEMKRIFPSDGLPITYFVNRRGEIVGTPVDGAQVDKYEDAVKDLLGQATGAAMNDAPQYHEVSGFGDDVSPATQSDTYRVVCVEEDGTPVAGARVQFCTDQTCMVGKTDASGAAEFDVNPGYGYTVHLLKPPEGYAADSTEYQAPPSFGDVTIVLKAA